MLLSDNVHTSNTNMLQFCFYTVSDSSVLSNICNLWVSAANIVTSAMLEYSLFHELNSAAFYKSKTVEFLIQHSIVKADLCSLQVVNCLDVVMIAQSMQRCSTYQW